MKIGKKRKKRPQGQQQQQQQQSDTTTKETKQPDKEPEEEEEEEVVGQEEVVEEPQQQPDNKMSDEAVTATDPPAEILPAKSEDKLEIEKEEAEKKEDKDESKEEEDKKGEASKGDKEDDKKDEDKKEDEPAAPAEPAETGTSEKKRFKMPNVQLKAPKVPGFLRSKSKERQKDKAEGGEEKKEGDEEKKEEDGDKKEEEGEEKKEGEEDTKDAKTKMKEAMENIHLPKMPKIHKPAFLKKKKEDTEEGEAKDEQAKEGEDKEKKEGEEGEEKVEGAEGQEEKKEGEEEKKKSGILDNLKNMTSHVHVPAFLSKSKANKDKEAEAGDKEESKELLEKKEGEEGAEEKKEGEEGEEAKKVEGEETEETEENKDKEKAASKGILESLRNVASHVPSMFSRSKANKDKEADVEAGEKEELLEDKDDSNKKEGEGDELEEVKVVSGDEEEKKKDPESQSHTSEKKDAEKPYCKYLSRAKEAKNACEQRYNELDRQKQLGVLGILALLILILLIIIICAACAPTNWTNGARIVGEGKYVETHTSCGPIQGLVEGPDQFSFLRIPYAASALNTDRWTDSKPMTTLADCHEGTFVAHSHNSSGSCWRRYPNGADGDENCLTVDIYTSSVVYTDLQPVVVYVDGDDLTEEEGQELQPSASLAKNHSVVFVKINYRRGVLGFLSLDDLSARSPTKSSGNYGLGDIISALNWIKINIQHFGGHPAEVTLMGRGSGATLVTALTASPSARGLFKQVWVTNGAGAYDNKTLEMADKENKVILETLNCGSDVVDCLIDATAEDVTEAAPYEWRDTNQLELPQVGEKGHSWIVIDKHILLNHPYDFWKKNQLSNKIPMVFGATAQGEVTEDNQAFMDWTDKDKFESHVESKLGSFNVTIPGQAMALYNTSDHWFDYASMLSDIRTVCPVQELASYVSNNFVSDIYYYVATQKRSGNLGGLADKTSDVAAIFGTYQTNDKEDEMAYVKNMQDMFYTFVRTSKLPQGKDLSLGMYTVDQKITTQRNYPKCEFWKNAQSIVPTYANLD